MQVLKNDKLLKKQDNFAARKRPVFHMPNLKRISGVITVVYVDEISILQMDCIFIINPRFWAKDVKNIPFCTPFTICPNPEGL